jgi:hypothetical protein
MPATVRIMDLSLRDAAQRVGTNKTTLLRAIKSGRMSARRTDTGSWVIDPAELFRVYPPRPDAAVPQPDAQRGVQQDAAADSATALADAPGAADAAVTELRIANARLEAQVEALKALAEDLRTERDRWHEQAQRLALAPPAVPRVSLWRRVFR